MMFKNDSHLKKYIEFLDTLYQTSVKSSQGINLCKFWREIHIKLQVIASCDHCKTPFIYDIYLVETYIYILYLNKRRSVLAAALPTPYLIPVSFVTRSSQT